MVLRRLSASNGPAAVRSEKDQNDTTNVSLGLMRPLYTSCSEHYHATQGQPQRQQSQRQQSTDNNQSTGSRFLCLNELPRMPSPSPPLSPSRKPLSADGQYHTQSPFLRLPTEIRLQIYSLLVLPRRPDDLRPSYEKLHASTQDYFDYDKKQHGTDRPLTASIAHSRLLIRTIDPDRYLKRYPDLYPTPIRSKYSVRCDRFRSACKRTTYHCVNNPRIEDQLGILRANKQCHAEAVELLYGSYTFDFDTHVEAIVPFLSDLTPFARSCIKNIRLVKRALAYEKEFDRCEWSTALRYLSAPNTCIALQRLELGVVAGRPGPNGWDRIPPYSAGEVGFLAGMEGFEWMQYLLELRGLKEVDVQAVVEHCPPGTNSMAMAGYIRFSASVEGGFREFLRGELLKG